jgi:hypothetical protein
VSGLAAGVFPTLLTLSFGEVTLKSLLGCVAFFSAALTAQMTLAQVVVRTAPPPPPHSAAAIGGPPPHPGYAWIPGYQRWDGRGYVWVPGRWVLPPRPGAVWVPATWSRRGDEWVFHPGHWRPPTGG